MRRGFVPQPIPHLVFDGNPTLTQRANEIAPLTRQSVYRSVDEIVASVAEREPEASYASIESRRAAATRSAVFGPSMKRWNTGVRISLA